MMLRFFTVTFLLLFTSAEENCKVPEAEISKITNILHHINETIYSDDLYESDNEECDRLINSIHMQLRRLTQRYKLMHKGYVEAEEKRSMVKDYEQQLKKLTKELEDLKKKTNVETKAKVAQLEQETVKLENEASTLQTKLKAVVLKYDEIKKELCLTFLKSKQMDNAKEHVKEMGSTYLLGLIDEALKGCNRNVLPVIDFCSAIPDLDDRVAAYQKIYTFVRSNNQLNEDSVVLLEAAVLKMNATLKSDSKICESSRSALNQCIQNLSEKTKTVFDTWINQMNSSDNQQTIKAALDHLFLDQMKYLGEKVSQKGDYYNVHNFLKLAVVSNNYYKLAAYRELTKKRVLSALAVIMFDMDRIKRCEIDQDKHVPEEIPKIFNETIEILPDSLKRIRSCNSSVFIRNSKKQECVVVTNTKDVVHHPTIKNIVMGDFKRAITNSTGCTRFRLELSGDRRLLRIVSHQGDPLTNINTAHSGDTFMSFVGAACTNKPGKHLARSTDWLLEANYNNDTIRIKSEFNAYQSKRSVDHLLVDNLNGVHHLFVRRYGDRGLFSSNAREYADWKIECAS